MPQIIHHPRLAWDTARVFVAAADTDETFGWLSGEVSQLLGAESARTLTETRERIRHPRTDDGAMVEAGVWRVRLEDALRARPETVEPLRALTTAASARLGGAGA